MRRYGLFILCLLCVFAPCVRAQVASSEVRECQDALLKRKVRNGEFTAKTLSDAMLLPVDLRPESDPKAVEQLFEKLGADVFEVRSAATEKLLREHYAPSKLSALLEKTDDPETRMRGQQVLDHWLNQSLKEDPKGQAEKKFLMWINLPTCLTKLKAYTSVYSMVCDQQLDQQRCYDVVAGLLLDDFPREQRSMAIAACLQPGEAAAHRPTRHFVQQLSATDWKDPAMLNPLREGLGNGETYFDSETFEALLFGIPDDADPADWKKILRNTATRTGAIAALLVKLGDKEALPDFVKLLNEEWREVRMNNGVVGGGGHSMFYSPFSDFKLLRLPAYRRFSTEILEGIACKFDDDRIAMHLAYLNAVRPFADTEAGLRLLARLSTHHSPQTAIAASLMLFTQKEEALKPLMDALHRASGQDLANNWFELARVLRILRGKILLDPANAERYRASLEEMVKLLCGQLAGIENYEDRISEFLLSELIPFGLCRIEREALVQMLLRCKNFDPQWCYPMAAVTLLVEDGLKNGDLDNLLVDLRKRAEADKATLGEEVLFASCVLRSGALACLTPPVAEKLWKRLPEKECPPQIALTAWIVSPQTAFSQMHPDVFSDTVSSMMLNPNSVDIVKVAAKLEKSKDPWRGQLLRLSYGLEGGRLADFDIMQGDFNQTVELFCGMSWAAKPEKAEALKKFAEMRLALSSDSKHDYKATTLLDGAADLLSRWDVELSEEKDTDLLALRIMAEIAFRRGDRPAYDRLMANVADSPQFAMPYYRRDNLQKQTAILDLANGNVQSIVKFMSARNSESDAYKLTSLIYESGFPEEARACRRHFSGSRQPHEWDMGANLLVWAWNEAIAGNTEEAIRLSEAGVVEASSKDLSDYALMLRRLLKENPDGFKESLQILKTRRSPAKRADAALALGKRAGSVTDPDLKSLAAFLAARTLRALGSSKEDTDPIWRMGAEAGGLHARYCRRFLAAVPEEAQEFCVTPNWYHRAPMGPTFTPFTQNLGICYKARTNFLLLLSAEWLDPYGIPASVDGRAPFHNGDGWWLYLRDQAKAWVPGEWSIILEHTKGIEYHQRTLLPYGQENGKSGQDVQD